MDLVAVLRVAMRRWLITVPIVLLAVGIGVWIEQSVDPVYEAAGSLLVTAPGSQDRPAPADVIDLDEVAERVRLGDEARALEADSPATTVTVEPTSDTVLEIVVEGTAAADVSAAADDLADQVIADVADVQADAGIEQDERITASRTAQVLDPAADEDGEVTTFTSTVGVELDDAFTAGENPLGADLATARIIQVVGQSDRARELVDTAGPQVTDYTLELEDFDQAPLMDVSVLAPSESDALEGFDAVLAVIADLIDERQAASGVPSFDRVGVEPVAEPGFAQDVSPPVSAGVVVVFALGVLLALFLAVLVDNMAARRRPTGATGPRNRDDPRTPGATNETTAPATTTFAPSGRRDNP